MLTPSVLLRVSSAVSAVLAMVKLEGFSSVAIAVAKFIAVAALVAPISSAVTVYYITS